MKRYEKYKPSGLPWVGAIPEHYSLKKLKYACSINARTLPETTDPDFELKYIDIGNVLSGSLSGAPLPFRFVDAPSRARRILSKGDTLISTVRTYLKAIAFIEDDEPNLIASTGFAVLTPSKNMNPKYLFYLMMSNGVVDTICSVSNGVSYPAATPFQIGNVFLPCPEDRAEQAAIACYLDLRTAQIEDLIAKKQQLIDLVNEEKTAIINHAVTKGINPNAPMKESGIPWLGAVPAHWELTKLKYIAKSIQTGNTPPSNVPEFYLPEIDWFTPSDFHDNLILSDSRRKISKAAIEQGVSRLFSEYSVFLVGIGATLGKVGLVLKPASSNQQINAITFGDELSAKYYLFFLLVNQRNIVSLSNSATLAILNQTQTKDLMVLIPERTEMEAIIRYIEDYVRKMSNAVNRIEQEIQLLQEYRTALINEAVTGKIDVRGAC